MINCSKCGHNNAKHYRFCLGCGAELPKQEDFQDTGPARSPRRRSSARSAFQTAPKVAPGMNTLINKVHQISSDIPQSKTPSLQPESHQMTPSSESVARVEPTVEATESIVEPAESTVEATESTVEPAESTVEPAESTVEPAESTVEPAESTVEPIIAVGPVESALEPLPEPGALPNEAPSVEEITSGEESLDIPHHEGLDIELDTPPPVPDASPFEEEEREEILKSSLNIKSPIDGERDDYIERDSSLDGEHTPAAHGDQPQAPIGPIDEAQIDSPATLDSIKDHADLAEESLAHDESNQSEYIDDAKFLKGDEQLDEEQRPKVRASAQSLRICGHCSAVVPKGFAFCGGCGTRYQEKLADEPINLTPPPLDSPSKSDSHYIRLIHIHQDGSEGDDLSLNIKQITLGREYDWHIFKNDHYLSPSHTTIFFQDGVAYIKDEGGLNGTLVKLKGTAELNHGDFFRAGQQLFRFERLRNLKGAHDPEGTRRLGSPFYQLWGRLCHIVGQGEIGQAWLLQEPKVELGRVRGQITFDQDRFMSGKHCALEFAQDRATLTDNTSTNGTFLRVQGTIPLAQGDLILLGQHIFRIDLGVV